MNNDCSVFHSVANEKVVFSDKLSVKLKFIIPAESDYFDGHFPDFKLLPAVAQFDLVAYFARKYLSVDYYVESISRIKFSTPLRPDTKVFLFLSYDENKSLVNFNLSDSQGLETFSSGSFSVRKI
ncbi:MAG: hydroxymyristoyl-ACP dehydratase [Treponema sp.]|nr:hydroxymyristoyl-ACP dehydratase [Treponema sp.]